MLGNRFRLKNVAINLILVSVSLLVSYVVLGSLLLAYGPAVAWRPFNKFPTAATIPWQASGPRSRDQAYIAVLGDSYAAGIGDWNANRQSRTDPYYSGDVISKSLGQPVLSFGKNGAGSVGGLVTNPGHIMNADSCMLLTSPPPPERIVVYVYEGNDFNNNLTRLGIPLAGTMDRNGIAKYIERKSESVKNIPCYQYVRYIIINLINGYWQILFAREETPDGTTGQAAMFDGGLDYIPKHLQGPALELDETSLDTSFAILSQSLDHLMQRFPGVPAMVVDVPSVLTLYNLQEETVSFSEYHGGDAIRPTSAVLRSSDSLCSRLHSLVLSKGASFLDARPALRKSAAKQKIHGPLDWKHLNRTGQTVLGSVVADAIKSQSVDSGCTRLAVAN